MDAQAEEPQAALLPEKQDLKTFSDEPFLFFVDGKGNYLTNGKAGDYLSTDVFEYDYAPGFGEKVIEPPPPRLRLAMPRRSPEAP